VRGGPWSPRDQQLREGWHVALRTDDNRLHFPTGHLRAVRICNLDGKSLQGSDTMRGGKRINSLPGLLASGVLDEGMTLYGGARGSGHTGVIERRGIRAGGRWFASLSAAANHLSGTSQNGWLWWHIEPGYRPLADLRDRQVATEPAARPSKTTQAQQ
jgi:hypothetical protein